MKTYVAFLIAEFKMYYRDRLALFWTLAFPTVLMLIFGFLNFGGDGFDAPSLGIVDHAGNSSSRAFITSIESGPGAAGSIETALSSDEDATRQQVRDGDLNAMLIIPDGFGDSDETAQLRVEVNPSGLAQSYAAAAMVEEVLNDVFIEIVDVPDRFQLDNWARVSTVQVPAVEGEEGEADYDYTSFVVTGIVAMSIMQSGVFSVAFIFVRLRNQGVLRRFKASPAGPAHFLIALIITRMVIILFQVYAMLLIATLVLDVDVGPGRPLAWVETGLIAVFASCVFIALGLVISNIAKTENSAAPLATGINMPMMFLSGVFFPLSVLPAWLASATQYLPLSFLADALRPVVISAEPLWSQGASLIGLAAWALVIFVLSVRVFRWE